MIVIFFHNYQKEKLKKKKKKKKSHIPRIFVECSLRLIGSAMFGDTFNLVTRVGLPYFLERWKMIVFKLIVQHQIIVLVTETSSKVASTLCQKWLTIFCQKAEILYSLESRTIRFCSNFTSMWSKYLSNNVWRDFRLNFQH